MSEWISVDEEMPANGKAVLVHYKNALGNGRTVKAAWIPRWFEEADTEHENYEYNDDDEYFYTLPGWYEQIDNWDEYAAVALYADNVVSHWMPLPEPPHCEGDAVR